MASVGCECDRTSAHATQSDNDLWWKQVWTPVVVKDKGRAKKSSAFSSTRRSSDEVRRHCRLLLCREGATKEPDQAVMLVSSDSGLVRSSACLQPSQGIVQCQGHPQWSWLCAVITAQHASLLDRRRTGGR